VFSSLRRLTFLLLGAAWLAACADAPRDPVALLVAPEARAALEVGLSLPGLGALAREASPGGVPTGDLARAEALWRAAGDVGDPVAAAALRDTAYGLAAGPLAAGLDSAALAGVQARLERWIEIADMALRSAQYPELTSALAQARRSLGEARAARLAGDGPGAVLATMRAADELTATTPRAVADRLTTEDEAALVRLRQLAGRPSTDMERVRLERIERLTRGAREALADGQDELSIRRAYYARELLVAEHALRER
jgi:hypothetical protein